MTLLALVFVLGIVGFYIAVALGSAGCYAARRSQGGGQLGRAQLERQETRVRAPSEHGIALPDGYVIEVVARDLTYPTGVAFDDSGGIYVVESGYAYGDESGTPRLLKIAPGGGAPVEIARGEDNGPWNGVAWHAGALYVAEGGSRRGGRILRVQDGRIEALAEDLPSRGDHHVNGPAIGPDGAVYFGIGTATNSGVVGEDSAQFGWLAKHEAFHDVPCADVMLRGVDFKTKDVRTPPREEEVETGAFLPFGTPSEPGQIVRGKVPCSGAVLRVPAAGGAIELVAWGFRNPFGLAFTPAGRLYATDNSYDDRGSRPVHGTGDLLWEVHAGAWYGWPDFHGTRSLSDANFFGAPGQKEPGTVLLQPPGPPQAPVAVLGVHSSSDGLDFSTSPEFGHVGQAFVAQFGDQAPVTGKVLEPVGFKVVRVDVETGVIEDFAVNEGEHNGPASKVGNQGLERPVAVRFDPTGRTLCVVDFGVLVQAPDPRPKKGTGVLWRIQRSQVPVAKAGGS